MMGCSLSPPTAGKGEGLNNPAMQGDHGAGPIPQGRYRIGPATDNPPEKGPTVMELTPDPRIRCSAAS
jgi:hypothetical protein